MSSQDAWQVSYLQVFQRLKRRAGVYPNEHLNDLMFFRSRVYAKPFVILTGASGSGKTTIAERIEMDHPEITVLRFDTIGVPSADVMATYREGHQPGGAWLRAMTLEWLRKIVDVLASGRPVLFEGQMWIAFLQEALQAHGTKHARTICVECDERTRTDRLTNERLQPELANESMMGWSRYLHQEAIDAGYEVFDTTGLSLAESTAHIRDALQEAEAS